MNKNSKLFKLLISVDQFFAVLLLNTNPDQTISGHVGYKALMTKEKKWLIAEKLINKLFSRWEQDHCFNAIEWDRLNRK